MPALDENMSLLHASSCGGAQQRRTGIPILDRTARKKNPVEADKRKNFGNSRLCVEDDEAVAGIAGGRVQSNQGCNASCVDALDRGEIERHGLPPREGLHVL
jgi:hypothetical protein